MTLYDFWQQHTGGSFAEAMQLIAAHAPDSMTPLLLHRLLAASAHSDYMSRTERGKVEQSLHSRQAPAPKASPTRATTRQDTVPDPASQPAAAPATTSAYARQLHKQHSHHHALLVSADSDEDRARHAGQIMKIILPALDAEYDRLRAGGDPARLPATDTEVPENSADTLRRLNTVRVRLSKLKHLLPQAPSLKRRQELENEQTEKEAERDRLELLLRK